MKSFAIIILFILTTSLVLADNIYVGYFETWDEIWSDDGKDLTLAKLPSYVNVVNLAFMKPDCNYWGGYDLSQTGLDFSANGNVVKTAIDTLRAKNPKTKILISVGGGSYVNWGSLNEGAVAKFVEDYGLDGVDIDYEPWTSDCTSNAGKVSCKTDAEFISIVNRFRAAIPSPKLVTIAAWSIGAYGQGDYQNAQPQGDKTGMAVNLLNSAAAHNIDAINIMGYDAGTTYDPKQAFSAYHGLYSGTIALGVEIPPEAWGGHVLSINELDDITNYVIQNGGSGMMIWALQESPKNPSDTNPNATMVSQRACQLLGLQDCDQPLSV